MSKKAIMDVLLTKVAADWKDAFIAEFRKAGTKEERIATVKKYCGELTAAEKEEIEKARGGEVTDEELDSAAGGCNCACSAHCSTECICGY